MQSDGCKTVVAYVPVLSGQPPGRGLLADLRGIVHRARRSDPELDQYRVVAIAIKHEGEKIRATVRFAHS